MSVTLNAVRDHGDKELEELRAKRTELLEKVADMSRDIATIETHLIINAHHALAGARSSGVPTKESME